MSYAGTVKGNIIELDEPLPFAEGSRVEVSVSPKGLDDKRSDDGPQPTLVVASIPSSGPGSDQPPKSIAELEREQNMPRERPDYCALASAFWQTPEQVAEFEAYVREMRQPQTRRANYAP